MFAVASPKGKMARQFGARILKIESSCLKHDRSMIKETEVGVLIKDSNRSLH